MTEGYLSRDRVYLAKMQRQRRAHMTRIDYMPGDTALAIIEAKRATLPIWGGLSTNSATIDAIVTEWAELTGIKYGEVGRPKSPAKPELSDQYARARMSSDAERFARAQESGDLPGINAGIAGGRAGAYESVMQRVTCGAKRHRDGQPCQAKSEPGKRRCRFHGGRSTGPRTPEGKAKALANLRQNQRAVDRGGNRGKLCD